MGNYTYDGKISLYKDELVNIARAGGFSDLLLIPAFNIIVSYQKDNGPSIY